jgi:hypothetical protein
MVCFQEDGHPDDVVYSAELQDDWIFKLNCRHGHQSHVALQQQRFEVLAELAVNAISDGHHREAIASFYAALERFYEFYFQVIFVTRNQSKDHTDKVWRQIGSQSERQLGAFIALYAADNSVVAPVPSQKIVELRNAVVHKGKFPGREPAIKFGESIIEIIAPVLRALRTQYREAVEAVINNHIIQVGKSIPKLGQVLTISIPTILSLARATP